MKVVELYCGIGGLHFALKSSTLRELFEVILAVDVNPLCTRIYGENFPETKVVTGNICSFTAADINSLSPDMLLMSPPCQPFTRLGKQKDVDDTRNDSFLQFMELIPELSTVSRILIENVKGFENSKTRQRLLTLLRSSGFSWEEYLLNPYQFGICNSRTRYYLLATKSELVSTNQAIKYDLPVDRANTIKRSISCQIPENISAVLEYLPNSIEWDSYLVPEEMLFKHFPVMDVVALDSSTSCCFTRGYSRFFRGTGSVVTAFSCTELENAKLVFTKSRLEKENNAEIMQILKKLRLRFFTPKEVARLMMFPDTFTFPDLVTRRQQYRVLSNSVNVYVVSFLISHLTA